VTFSQNRLIWPVLAEPAPAGAQTRFNDSMMLTRSFTASQFAQALDSWQWAGIEGKEPLFTSPFGDVIFRAPDGFWYLDLLDGTLTRPWQNAEIMQADLNTTQGQGRYLLARLAAQAEHQGIIPSPSQVLSFTIPPALGGAITAANIQAADFTVTVDLAGQLHQQLANLPPGTPITGFKVTPHATSS
jgi:hypothetical protein